MVANLGVFGFGAYVFFAAMNATFLPIIYFFYPETKQRSLEEIDLIFAKGYLENISYVKAAQDLPSLTDREIEAMAREYGFVDADDEKAAGEKRDDNSRSGSEAGEEKTTTTHTDATPVVPESQNDGIVETAPPAHVIDHSKHEGFRND